MVARGPKLKHGGSFYIANAERLFFETNDFRYVALAIGANPVRPPDWAIEACIAERMATERTTSMTSFAKKGPRILDLAIALMAKHEDDFFLAGRDIDESQYEEKPLATALREALLAIDPNPADIVGAVKNLENAWKREQREELLDETLPSVQRLREIPTTARIHRVLTAMEEWNSAPGSPLSADPELLVWDAMRLGLLPR